MSLETIYNSRDNELVLSLYKDNVLVNHSLITKYQLKVGEITLDSDNLPALFDNRAADRLVLRLGQQGFTEGRHIAKLYIFDLDHINGLHWGNFVLLVAS
jgi:membrane protease subunit (stomatin/prohibitin family)